MKTPKDFARYALTPMGYNESLGGNTMELRLESFIEARDAEHIAESKAREEALQAELEQMADKRDSASKALAVVQLERDRLSTELDSARVEVLKLQDDLLQTSYREVALEQERDGLRERENLLSEHCNDRNALKAECDRLKGELAEMADELAEASDIIDDAMEHGGDIDQKRARKFLEAAPSPAESTGVKRNCQVCGRELPSFWSFSVHRECMDKELPAAPPDDIRLDMRSIEEGLGARVSRAEEKAQRAANECAKLERRLQALEGSVSRLGGALFDHQVLCPCKPRTPAAPQEQAGQSRHRYISDGKKRCMTCGLTKDVCEGEKT